MAKVKWKGGTMLAPLPAVIVSCGTMENPNAMTAAWTGILNSNPPKTYVSIRPERFSHDIIKNSGEFAINLTTESLVRATDYIGVKSGREENKLEKLKLKLEAGFETACPTLAASPVTLECKVTDVVPLGSHDMFVADIVCVSVDDGLIDESGKLCLNKAGLIAYSHGDYLALGKKLGSFGFSVKKKKKAKK